MTLYLQKVRSRVRLKRKTEFLNVYRLAKEDKCCLDCLLPFPPVCLDFDHRDPTTKSKYRGNRNNCYNGKNGAVKLIQECDLICVCCHRLRTEKNQSNLVKQPVISRGSKLSIGRQERNIRRRQLIRETIRSYKEGHSCKDCGKTFPPVCMDFDHILEKTINISLLPTNVKNIERVLEEISKCELVCANCHRIRTENRRIS
jgi:hypothetical protein